MSWRYTLPLRLRSLFRRSRVERELDEEFQYHLDRLIGQNLAQGMAPEDARYAALRRMDGVAQRQEECRDTRRVRLVENFIQDLRFAARILRKKPAFTLVAILSLALGIGVNTAVFSLLNTLLLTKLPVRDPDKLYQLIVTHRIATGNAFSYTNYEKLRTAFDFFEDVAAWSNRDFELQVDQTPLRAHGALATGSFYGFMGVKPAIGRLIEPSDDTVGNASVAVLGYGFWQRQFSADPGVLGKVIRVEGAPFTVIGVTSPEFGGAEIDNPRDVTLPLHAIKRYNPADRTLENPGSYSFAVLVRLKPGTTMESARPVLRDLWPRLDEFESQAGSDSWRQKLDIQPGGFGVSRVRSEFSQALLILMILVALVLLIVCANLANLLLARGLARRKEIAVRLAIGANRTRLIRQSLTESLLLAAIGGAAGIVLATWITRGLLLFLPQNEAGFLAFQLDYRMLLFAMGATLGTALLFGLLPAFQAVRFPLNVVMSDAGRVPGAARRPWLSRAVVAAQVSVCLVLVIASLLFTKSLQNISRAGLGFQRENLFLVDVNLARAGIRGEQNDLFYKRLLDQLNDTPGILSASCSRVTPVAGARWWDPAVVPGYVPARDEMTTVYMNQVSPAYFRTMGIPLLGGREFTAADDKKSRRVAIVSQSFARRYYRGQNPLGRVFSTGTGAASPSNERYAIFRDLQIVGVVADTKYSDPHEEQKDLMYIASYQAGLFDITGALEVRTAPGVSADALAKQVRAMVNRLGSGLTADVRPYNSVFERSLQRDQMLALLSGLFGILGAALACIGLYGIMAQSVASRTGEIGIRMTLGAKSWQVEWLVLREALVLVGIGVAIGVPLALASTQFARGLLYNLQPSDPAALLMGGLFLLVVGAGAAWFPARRASRIDPIGAIRYE